ncbi:VWA domain-containing protein [Sedimentitalea sp. JM2-8]|uniref:VWA domain-containing protein n=1 Tax=Sedimentitalea xiamensis TaxID=3050037 RepID=A0ABT7FKQ5_9RHOB|nr:VWA domain-containing protein [Sedimentitalea xiamensis]MDK3075711.1 VWA domain-containing protein [Sedimentitalea xiamensis]
MTTRLKFANAAAALAAFCSFALAGGGMSQPRQNCTDDAMLVFDASGSMAEMGYNGLDAPRIVEARAALRDALPSITPYRRLGLIVYGPGSGDSCANIDLRFLPRPDAAGVIIADVDRVQPDGDTPLTQSVRNAADALRYKTRPGTIVLVTDGKETCGGSPCLLAAELAQTGPGLTVHVIGFRVRSAFFSWKDSPDAGNGDGQTVARCLADRTGGHYVSTENTADLVRALQLTLGCPLYGHGSRWRQTG